MRILLIQTAFIGDVALTTPLITALRKRFAGSTFHIVTTPQGAELLAGLPDVVCHALDKKKTGLLQSLRQARESLGTEAFDFVFCVHRSLRSLWLGKSISAKRRVAFRSMASRILGYETVPYPSYNESVHYVDKTLALLGVFGSVPPRTRPELVVEQRDVESVAIKLASIGRDSKYIVLSPFSVWGTKMWFADRYAALGVSIANRYKCPIVVIGGADAREAIVAQTIVEKIQAGGGEALSLVGRTSLGELKQVIHGATLVIANDSAPVHIAAAFDVPTVAIFGPTVRKWGFFPLATNSMIVERQELPCRPCHIHGPPKCPLGHFKCMDQIQVEDVVSAVEKII